MCGVASGWLGVGECHLPVHSAVAEYRESLTVCSACKCYCPHHMTSGTFQGGYSAMFIASRRVFKGARRVMYP